MRSMKLKQHLGLLLLLALSLFISISCDSASAGDSAEAGGGGDDSGSTTLDTSDMLVHLSFDNGLTEETGSSANVAAPTGSGPASVNYAEDRHGRTLSAIEFNSATYWAQVTGLDLSTYESITVLAWIRDDGSRTSENRRIAAYDSGSTTVEFSMRIRELNSETWQDNSFEAFVENSGSNGTRTLIPVTPGSWVHVAMVYDNDAGELRLYQNGVRRNTANVTLVIASGALNIGGGKSNLEFHGRIDDLAVFPRALSSTEVSEAMNRIRTDQ